MQKECSSFKNLVSRTTSFVSHRTKKSSGTIERDSSIEGTCSRRISRQEQHHVSYSPSGSIPESKNLEDSISSSCATNNFKLISYITNNLEDPEFSCCSKKALSCSKSSCCITNNPEDSESSSCSKKPSLGKSLRIESPIMKDTAKCCFGWFQMYSDPMFVVITTTMSLHTFVVVCMITIIEDFAKDLHVPDNRVHCVLMALSIADLFGALTLGVITDRRFMSSCCFVVLCFFGAGVCIIAISYSRTLTALLALVSFYGVFETGVVITLPLLITQFIEGKRQAVALAASNILSSPTVMLVPLVIGYFRDRIGCYSGVFYVLAITSFSSSLIWLVAPYLINKYRSRRKTKYQC